MAMTQMVSVYVTATSKVELSNGVIAETQDNDRFVSFKDASGAVLGRYRWAEIIGYVLEDGPDSFEHLVHSESSSGVVVNLSGAVSIAREHVTVETTDKWTVFLNPNGREVARFRSGAIVGYRVEPEAPIIGLYRRIHD